MGNNTSSNNSSVSNSSWIKIELLGSPLSTNSVYKHARGISYLVKKARELKKSYIEQVTKQYKHKPLSNDLKIIIAVYFADKRKHDWDNAHKLSMDSLNKIVWEDDSQIQLSTVYKLYDKINPRIEIYINNYDKEIEGFKVP